MADHRTTQRPEPQRPCCWRVSNSLEAAERGLDPRQAAGQQEALHQFGGGSTTVRAPLPERPQHQLLGDAELTDDDIGKLGHVRTPCMVTVQALLSHRAQSRKMLYFRITLEKVQIYLSLLLELK